MGSRSRPFFRSRPWALTTSTIIVVSEGKARRPTLTLIGSWPPTGAASATAAQARSRHQVVNDRFIARLPGCAESRLVDDGLVGQPVEVLRGHRSLEHVPEGFPFLAPRRLDVEDPAL